MEENKDLEYRIGGLKIHPDLIRYEGDNPRNADHKFVAEALGNVVSIYVAGGGKHSDVTRRFNLSESALVGGGSCYTNAQGQLVLDDYSMDYRAIPKLVAQTFAELIVPELRKQGVNIRDIAVNPDSEEINSFWVEREFDFSDEIDF